MRYYPDPARDLDVGLVNDAIEEAFAEQGRGNVQMPPKVYINLERGDFRTMPAYIPSMNIAGVKIVNVHPGNPGLGLPTVMALTVILDVETGVPLAILNATDLTDLRTGAAGAVAAKYLSPRRTIRLGLVGSGRQALAQLQAIARELPVEEVLVWSRDGKNAESFCRRISESFACRSVALPDACGCDIVVTTTPSREPLVKSEWIGEGTHINAIGADAPGKEELDPVILERARVFVDDPVQAVHSGEVNVPIGKGIFSAGQIAGTLGELVLGKKKKESESEITVFDSTGLAIQDLVLARLVLEKPDGFIELKFP